MPKRPPVFKPHGYRTDEQRRTDNDTRRGSSTKRGYDYEWQKLRLAKLKASPLCECDECQAGKLRVTPATVVDHIKPISQYPELRLEWSNLRSMSKEHHDRHTAKTQGFASAAI